ncbi:group II intron reverse transcriptase/maturase [Flavobacterium sp.]|uniref:group II intron reverse transcriptase/maturase n=1 Tax=Flavobacterium sp. TaxID=239 RepID=UPI00260A76E1|nr:group II intron reverse transcriptase/maturase [Flavobacterium sp.]
MIDYYETKSQPIAKVMVWQAFKEVRANKGSGGIDKMSWEYLEENKKTELYKLWNRLTSGSYYPNAVKQVCIPKKDGGIRKLGIPIILDRIAQQVVKRHLERKVEPLFHKSSFGYRPNRNAHQAVKQANENSFNHDFAIDLDIKGFFDNIDHELLMKTVKHYCQDRWVSMYIERWLKAGVVQQDGSFSATLLGTPQGGVISPLLANLFLHVVFDKWMEKHHPEKPFERYADDIVVHCKTEKQALYLLHLINKRMESCKLSLHPEKSKIVNLRGFSEKKYPKGYDFLGFTIRPSSVKSKGTVKTIPSIFVSQKSKNSLMEKFRKLNVHKRRTTLEEIAKMMNPILRGIINYYHKFRKSDLQNVWRQLNERLLKWVKWEKGLYKKASVRYLKTKHKEKPDLFLHWLLVHP